VRDDFSVFGFGGEDAGDGPFVDFFFGRHREPTGELLITDGLGGAKRVNSAWTYCGGKASMIS
jgi:hypothetical protein